MSKHGIQSLITNCLLVAFNVLSFAEDVDVFLATLGVDKANIEKLHVAGCDPKMQQKMFRDAFEHSGFDKTKHFWS